MNNSYSKLIYLLILQLLLIFHISAGEASAEVKKVNSIFLIQNSGWMEPFYADSNSKFKSLVYSVIEKVTEKGDEVVVATFNQSKGDNRSPLLEYRGKKRKEIADTLRNLKLAKKTGEKTFADTDFKEAVVGAISEYSPGSPCILWIFTNNKNSPDNSLETAGKNKEFYRWLQGEEGIKRIVAYPYPMPVKAYYQANGLMIYALAYGNDANDQLERLTASKRPFDEKPARLKPLNADAVTFVPIGVSKKGNCKASLGKDGSTLVIQFNSSNKPEEAVIKGVFRNDFFPYDIKSADITFGVKFIGENYGLRSSIFPDKLDAVATGKDSTEVSVIISTPKLQNIWSHPDIIFKSGHQAKGIMEFILTNQQLQISPEFIERMKELFPGDPLPDIFVPGQSARHSVTIRPLLVKVEYPVWPLILLVIITFGIVSGTIWLISSLTRPKKFIVSIDGMQQQYLLKSFGQAPLFNKSGEDIGMLKRRLCKPQVQVKEGCELKVKVL